MKIQIPEKLQFLFRPKRLKIGFGGRGGAKTVSYAKAILFLCTREKKRVLCLREFMNSIDDSVHATFKEEIEELGLSSFFTVTNNQIKGKNGSLIRYASLSRNLASIKSRHDIDIAWIEEAETITQKSLDVLIPTIRKPESEIWISFNPDDEFGAVYHTLVKPYLSEIDSRGFYQDKATHITKINLTDNPFAPQVMLDESAKMKEDNLKKWMHIYGGEVFSDYRESIIQPEWVSAAIDSHKKLNFPPQGVKVVGFDPADTGKDAKAVMLRHGSVVTNGFQWSHGDIGTATDLAYEKSYEWRAEQLVYDSDGLGRGVRVLLEKKAEGKNIAIIGYGGNESVNYPDDIYERDKSNKDTFKNKRAQYHWYLRDRFEKTFHAVVNKTWIDPDELISISSEVEDLDVLKSELISLRRKPGDSSYIQMEGKDARRSRSLKSYNLTDALIMLWAGKPPEADIQEIIYDSEF